MKITEIAPTSEPVNMLLKAIPINTWFLGKYIKDSSKIYLHYKFSDHWPTIGWDLVENTPIVFGEGYLTVFNYIPVKVELNFQKINCLK